MDSLSRFWAFNAIFLGIWEALAIATHRSVPTISMTAARARRRWRIRTLIFLLAWSHGLVGYLYTKDSA
jgi:hypothetical protein